MNAVLRSIITPAAVIRLVLGWGAVVALSLFGSLLEAPAPAPLLITALVVIIGVILLCAFGVVHEAEHLAHRLGDPYGSLVLTLSIVLIEVILIAAVLLGPGDHATIARDSVMAVSMIILGAVVGICVLVGGLRHGDMEHNRTGTSAYLSLIVVLSALAFALPAVIGEDGSYLPWQEIPIIVLTIAIYVFFLVRQMGAQADDFREVDPRLVPAGTAQVETTQAGTAQLETAEVGSVPTGTAQAPAPAGTGHAGTAHAPAHPGILEIIATHRVEIVARLTLLVITVLPIVLLSHDMAALLDDGLSRLGAPTALSGIVIAMIVFLPETITAIRAAWQGEVQRVSNLCHGALVSTVGLTIPVVLVIGLLTGQQIVLAEGPANLLLLGVVILLSVATFAARKVTAVHGAALLIVFAAYGISVFS
ncbi:MULTISPECIES: calcium:proton antiporter [unclassified Brevibacterium]|uniref:calcium:proton antiporter n=1 Tax=unclassified Brevibacterium TaxID=2614124 RepID=UPI0010F5983A|nr:MULTISPECIES: calcium:proton antiporter [unclassified Brevibacterium]MCM1011547.1 calcium:proton antiporter [Brevibacterium sp. XM4083]